MASQLWYNTRGERYVNRASEADKQNLPILSGSSGELLPSESKYIKIPFEVLNNTEPSEFSFKLLGSVKDVIVKIE